MNRARILMAAALLVFGACTSISENSEPEAIEERSSQMSRPDSVLLAIGQEVAVAGTNLRVRFDAVRTDSRCPIDAICVTAGDAEIEITLTAGSTRSQHVLHWANSANRPGSAVASGYRVSLVQLDPMPRAATGAPAPSSYRLHLKVERI